MLKILKEKEKDVKSVQKSVSKSLYIGDKVSKSVSVTTVPTIPKADVSIKTVNVSKTSSTSPTIRPNIIPDCSFPVEEYGADHTDGKSITDFITDSTDDQRSASSSGKRPVSENKKKMLIMNPSRFTPVSQGKQHIFASVGNNNVAAGSGGVLNNVVQGDGIDQRLGDRIYCHGVHILYYMVWYPHTTGATGQVYNSAAAALDTNWTALATEFTPPTAGATAFTMGWSGNNPPSATGGYMWSVSTQNSAGGNILHVNPLKSNEVKIHKFWSSPLVPHNDGNYQSSVLPEVKNAAAVVTQVGGTLGPRIISKSFYVPLRYITTFDAGTDDAAINLLSITTYAKYSLATRQGGGYVGEYSYNSRLHFSDVDDDS